MKRLHRSLCTLLVLTMLAAMWPFSAALADRMYLIPDSDTRVLTEEELWEWDYESLGYILNEIFARHGYVFNAGGSYDRYFRSKPWYTPNSSSDNQLYCYPKLSSVEWKNEETVKSVRAQMKAYGTTNPGGKSVWDVDNGPRRYDLLMGFEYLYCKAGQKWPVYSAPGYNSYRSSNGKAMLSTNGAVYAAGWEGQWLLVMYETNNGSVRVGYVPSSEITGSLSENRALDFAYTPAYVTRSVALTDDPAYARSSITQLYSGTDVTYLTSFVNDQAWDYVEVYVNGQAVRGFIPVGNLNITTSYGDGVSAD